VWQYPFEITGSVIASVLVLVIHLISQSFDELRFLQQIRCYQPMHILMFSMTVWCVEVNAQVTMSIVELTQWLRLVFVQPLTLAIESADTTNDSTAR